MNVCTCVCVHVRVYTLASVEAREGVRYARAGVTGVYEM